MRVLLLMAAMIQYIVFSPVQEQPVIIFSQNTTKLTFPDKAVFSTTITGKETVTDVELLYGSDERTCSEVQALAVPEFKPGKNLRVSWEWNMLDSGGLPPGTQIWWQWRVTNEAGETVTTEKQTVTWIDRIHPWKELEDQSIRLHYYTISADKAREYLETATGAMERLKEDTGMEASGTVDLYLYATGKDMRDALLYEPTWTGAMAFPDHNKVVVGISENVDWTKRTEAHELTHVLTGNYTFTCLWMTPTWLEEGLAVYGEGDPDEETQGAFEEAKENDYLLSFRVLSASFAEESEQASLSYSQSYYMVDYLIETYGRDKINRLLKVLSRGTVLDEALEEVYGFDLLGFEKEWRESIDMPEAEWYQEALIPTAEPTEVPTMLPVVGVKRVYPTNTPLPTRTPMPTATTVPTATAIRVESSATQENTVTPVPTVQSSGGTPGSMAVILVMIGVLVTGVVVFLVIRSKNKKNTGISAIVFLFLGTAALSVTPVKANGLQAEATKYPQLPTATLFTPPPTEEGYYTNNDVGIRMRIPSNAKIDTSKANAAYHFSLSIENKAVIGHLFSSGLGGGKTLEDIAHRIRENELEELVGVNFVEDEAIEMDDGSRAWLTVSEGRLPDDPSVLKVSIVTVRGYTTVTSLLLFSTRDVFEYFQEEIDDINTSLEVIPPTVSGFARDEILIMDSSESDNPRENDPATTRGSGGFDLVFSGLVTYDVNLKLKPDLAKSWDVSDDGLVYTFHLQPEAVFHNMRPVTAEDVVYSWDRAAAPETDSDTVMTYLGDIRGMKERHEGTAESISGLMIIDEHTLEVTLEKPVPYFLLKLTYPTSYIVDRENVEKGKKWYLTPNGTGPFRLSRWESQTEIWYERFDSFYGEKPKIKAILLTMYQGTSQQLYELGVTDLTGVSYSDLVRFTDPSEPMHDELQSNLNMCTSYITMDVTQPPFDDLKVRQAFAMSVDKDQYVKVIAEGGAIPARGLYPPAMPGYDRDFKGLEYDPEKARQLIQDSKYGEGEFPEVIYSRSNYGSSVSEGTAAIVQMWEENLGIKITIQNIDPEYYQDVVDSGKHGQLINGGWCADYPDPENFADVLFHTDAEMNRSNYSNPELDELLENARVEEDVNKRIEMYQKAEEIIVNDAPAVFWTHSRSYVLVKPYLKGYVGSPIDIPLERYLWIDSEKFLED